MTSVRRFQATVIAALVLVLATPAIAACCAWTTEPMPCCEKSENAGVAAECCMSQADTPQPPVPASTARISRLDAGLAVLAAAPTLNVVPATSFDSAFDQFSGPPASERLYLRLSVIRR
jgi:hypothetical protein